MNPKKSLSHSDDQPSGNLLKPPLGFLKKQNLKNYMKSIFQDINNILFPKPKPNYSVDVAKASDQSSSIVYKNVYVVATFYTQNHIEMAEHYCALLNSKK